MYRYIDYFIKCCIRRITRLIFKPKIFLTIVIILLITFFCFKSSVFAVYEGDDTYTDKNATLFASYDTIANDLVNRLANSTSSINVITQWLKNSNYNYYLYYGDITGSSMINSSTYKTDILYIVIFSASSPELSSTAYDNYQGINTQIRLINNPYRMYYFEGNEPNSVDTYNSVYAPTSLLTYKPENLVNYLNNTSSSDTQEIVESIDNTTTAVDNLNNTILSADEGKAETDLNDTYNSVTSTTSSQDSNASSLFDFFKQIYDVINNNITDGTDVITIQIGLPFVGGKSIELTSDILSNMISGTLLYNIIQVCYYSVFGMYVISTTWKIILWFQTGQFLNGSLKTHNIINDMIL